MKGKIYQVDAFTETPYGGNPAGVFIDTYGLSDKQMQVIAKEMNLSETAFVYRGDDLSDFEVRFFTPIEEVDLCGHATIAVFSLLKELKIVSRDKKEVIQKTRAGYLKIKYLEDNSILMEQKDPIASELSIEVGEILEAMNVSKESLGVEGIMSKPEIWSTGLFDILLPIKSVKVLKEIDPNMIKLSKLSKKLDVTGVHGFTVDEDENIWCRNFAPAVGIDEEAATGTSNGALGACLYSKGWKKDKYLVKQGQWMGRESKILAKIEEKDGKLNVWVGGRAVTVLSGEIVIPKV